MCALGRREDVRVTPLNTSNGPRKMAQLFEGFFVARSQSTFVVSCTVPDGKPKAQCRAVVSEATMNGGR